MKRIMQLPFSCLRVAAIAWIVLTVPGLTARLIAQDAATSKLTIRVVGARNSRGQIAFALFNGEGGFPGDKSKAVRTLQVRIDPQTLSAQVTVDGLPRGVYAVSVFHDENMNSQLDKNIFGIPKEGYALPTIQRSRWGRPNSPMRSSIWTNRKRLLKSSCFTSSSEI